MTEDKAKELIVKACKSGNVSIIEGKEDVFNRMQIGNSDFTVTKVEFAGAGKMADNAGAWFSVEWETVSAGFGSLGFRFFNDGRVLIENECMGKEFIVSVLAKMVEGAELADKKPEKS